jgi:hypothetical protein
MGRDEVFHRVWKILEIVRTIFFNFGNNKTKMPETQTTKAKQVKTERVFFRITPSMKQKLNATAKERGGNMSEFIIKLIKKEIADS